MARSVTVHEAVTAHVTDRGHTIGRVILTSGEHAPWLGLGSTRTPAAPLAEAALVVGGYVWWEERLFETLGAWVPVVPEAEVKLHLAADSHHHAWHASLWRDRLPQLREMEDRQFVMAPGDRPGTVAFLTALGAAPTTVEKLVGVYRVALPRQLATYQRHLEQASGVADGPTIRALQLVLADELADWRRGELLVQAQLVSADDVQRAATHQARLETLLL